MPTYLFYASVYAQSQAGTSWTNEGGADLAASLRTAEGIATGAPGAGLAVALNEVTANTFKVLEGSSWKHTVSDAAPSVAIPATETLVSVALVPSLKATLGDPPSDTALINASACRLWDTGSSQSYTTAGTPRNSGSVDLAPYGSFTEVALATWATAQPTMALIKASGFKAGFRAALDGGSVSSQLELDQLLLRVITTAPPRGGLIGARGRGRGRGR